MFPSSPTVLAAACLCAGILTPASWRPHPLLVAAGCAALLLAGLRGCRDPGAPRGRLLIIPCAFLPLGLFLASSAAMPATRGAIGLLLTAEPALSRSVALVEGTIAAEPRRRPPPDGGCALDLDLARLGALRVSREASGRVRASFPAAPGDVPDPCRLFEGTRVRFPAAVSLPRSFGNPGALDYPVFLASRGIDALARAPSARLVAVTAPPSAADRALGRARRFILDSIDAAFESAGVAPDAPIAKALVLGWRDDIAPTAEAALRAAGTSHLLAVSGFNVAIVAACVLTICRLARAPRGGRAPILAISLVAYAALTGREASVARAVAGALMLLAARGLGRRARPLPLIAAVLMLLAALDPRSVADPAFQLTFAAAAALAAYAPPLVAALPGPRWLASMIAVDLAALAATAPLSASLFNRVAPAALLANLAASPLMSLAFIASCAIPAVAALAAIHPAQPFALLGASLLARGASLAIDGAVDASARLAAIPWLSYACVTPAPALVAMTTAAFFAPAIFRGTGAPRRAVLAIGVAVTAAGTLLVVAPGEKPSSGSAGALGPAPPGSFRLTVLDVGQGSSALVEMPDGARLLVDGGGFAGSTFDVGERIVARALLTTGLRRLDAVAATHADFDHVGGLPAILRTFAGTALWVGAADHSARRLVPLERLAVESGRALRIVRVGGRSGFEPDAIDILNPPASGGGARDNDVCQVIRIRALGRSILLPGDIEAGAERAILPALAPVDVLLVPHHGSRTSSTTSFLAALQPRLAIVSCGFANRYGHPHAEAIARLQAAGARVLRTDRDGAVRVTFNGAAGEAGISIERFASGWIAVTPDRGSGDGADGARDE
ncbi:MAG: ComEC/Rec2 family competence protein [Acidobacteria bacterium]|nr:ComEC/Rec2 family competence protein [Acidobacteriota bacterium]